MDKPTKFMLEFVDYVGDFAAKLDTTGWLILATCSIVAGYALLKGPGIQRA